MATVKHLSLQQLRCLQLTTHSTDCATCQSNILRLPAHGSQFTFANSVETNKTVATPLTVATLQCFCFEIRLCSRNVGITIDIRQLLQFKTYEGNSLLLTYELTLSEKIGRVSQKYHLYSGSSGHYRKKAPECSMALQDAPKALLKQFQKRSKKAL